MSNFKFEYNITMTRELLKGNPDADEWHEVMADILPKNGIDTIERVAGFIAQCSHESNNFRTLEENLNYSANNLLRVFGRYFGPAPKRNAAEYARNPEKLANYVYMDVNRTSSGKLGNVQPGDGWKFRGRGIKQLTGRNNFSAFGKSINISPDDAVLYVATKKGAIHSACWFWVTNNLNSFADKKDIVGMSRRINGGDIGLADRKKRWYKALKVLSGTTTSTVTTTTKTSSTDALKRGSNGPRVIRLQKALGITADGIFGIGTAAALKQWQRGANMQVTGIADAETIKRLLS